MPDPDAPDAFALTCEWVELCNSTAAGMAAHFDKGVIPVCKYHVDAFRIRLITTTDKDH